jgi:hypothetical protein
MVVPIQHHVPLVLLIAPFGPAQSTADRMTTTAPPSSQSILTLPNTGSGGSPGQTISTSVGCADDRDRSGSQWDPGEFSSIVTNLSPGDHTVTARYQAITTGCPPGECFAAVLANRSITVIPLP